MRRSITALETPALTQLTRALADGARVLADLAQEADAEPCARTLDAVLSQARGITMIALRAHRQLGGDPPPHTPPDPLAPIGRAA